MTFEIFSNDFKKLSENLNNRINLFKINQLNKENHFVYEQNQFDIFLNNIFVNFGKIILVTINKLELKKISIEILKMIKILFEKLISSISKISENSNKLILKSKALEKKLEDQENFIKLNTKENQELKNEIGKINSALTKILEQPESFIKNPIPDNLGHNSISKVDFYQEENVRLGSELVETKKKFEILKSEIEKYEQQRSNLITKINSVNDALNDTNVLTNVFKNEVKSKVNIIDHKKIERKSNQDLNEQIKNIFLNK
tara:strand:+ start:177 stop:953 length:777 start_codon:yes stop_codon:yes gene_type:complete